MSGTGGQAPTLDEIDALRLALDAVGSVALTLEYGDVRLQIVPAARAAVAPPAETPAAAKPAPTINSDGPGILRLSDPSGGAAFVTAGCAIEEGQIVALLEVGTALLPLHADKAGRAAAILAAEGDLVGYGTPIIQLAG